MLNHAKLIVLSYNFNNKAGLPDNKSTVVRVKQNMWPRNIQRLLCHIIFLFLFYYNFSKPAFLSKPLLTGLMPFPYYLW